MPLAKSKYRQRAVDDLAPVGAEDPERAAALAKHEEGLTVSQDKKANDFATGEVYKGHAVTRLPSGRHYVKTPDLHVETGFANEAEAKKWVDENHQKGEKMKDAIVEPVPIKTSNLVPMPAEEDDKQKYAVNKASDVKSQWQPDSANHEKLDQLHSEVTGKGYKFKYTGSGGQGVMRHIYRKGGSENTRPTAIIAEKKSGNHEVSYRDAAAKATDKTTCRYDGECKWCSQGGDCRSCSWCAALAAKESAKATDSIATLPIQVSGSEPKDHMVRAAQYEIAGDRARALDSYRAAASGYRRTNDRVGETLAREGVAACQSVGYDRQYDHPGAGRVKVCDSAEQALRTAAERTRAGERVHIVDGRTVRPGRAKDDTGGPGPIDNPKEPDVTAPVPDEHLGFKKLEGKLAHEKGVRDPAAVAAAIGRKKYGAEGMAKKSAAARDANAPIHPDMGANAAKNWEPFVEKLKANIDTSRDARVRRMNQETYDDAKRALEGLRNAKDERTFNMWADSLRMAKRKATDSKEVQPV
jgi:hypothetical protein